MYKQILDATRDGVLVINDNGQIVYANQSLANIFSLNLAEIFGKRVLEAIRVAELTDLLEEAREKNISREKEIKVFFPAEKALYAAVNPLVEEKGEKLWLIVFWDISEIKKLENLRREFVANVSHELKTPLTSIRGAAETLLDGALADQENNRRFVEKIERNAVSLSALIDDILEISKLETRRGLFQFGPIGLEKELQKAVEALADKIEKKRIKIVKKGQIEACEIVGDIDLIYRALLNLLDNAVKFSPEESQVEISCAGDGRGTRISVKDHGQGISAEHLPRIFERFYRADKARSRELGGTGLGLSIVKHIMDVHGGLVEVESEEGKGSKFTLVFPVNAG